jgi:ketosteroid isomerase-like protein
VEAGGSALALSELLGVGGTPLALLSGRRKLFGPVALTRGLVVLLTRPARVGLGFLAMPGSLGAKTLALAAAVLGRPPAGNQPQHQQDEHYDDDHDHDSGGHADPLPRPGIPTPGTVEADTWRAMSQENVDVVRRMVRAFNDGDIEALVAECDPAVEWEEQFIPGVDPLYRGHEGVRRWWSAVIEDVGEVLGSLEARIVEVRETGDTVIGSLRLEGVGASSGVRVPMHVHMVATFRDGKVVRRQVFTTGAEALEAVGRRP